MPTTYVLNERLDLLIRASDRVGSLWECRGDIVERHNGKMIVRVYGRGRNQAEAGAEIRLEGGKVGEGVGRAR